MVNRAWALGQWDNDLMLSPARDLVVVRMQQDADSYADVGYRPGVFDLFDKISPIAAVGSGS